MLCLTGFSKRSSNPLIIHSPRSLVKSYLCGHSCTGLRWRKRGCCQSASTTPLVHLLYASSPFQRHDWERASFCCGWLWCFYNYVSFVSTCLAIPIRPTPIGLGNVTIQWVPSLYRGSLFATSDFLKCRFARFFFTVYGRTSCFLVSIPRDKRGTIVKDNLWTNLYGDHLFWGGKINRSWFLVWCAHTTSFP